MAKEKGFLRRGKRRRDSWARTPPIPRKWREAAVARVAVVVVVAAAEREWRRRKRGKFRP